jgi:PAS domain S-box-containing protein
MGRTIHFLRSSVRGRLVLLVLAIALPASLLVTLLVLQGYRNERDAVGEHLLATARAIASVVDQQVGRTEAQLKELAAFRELEDRDFAAFRARAQALASGDERWVILSDASGQPIVDTRVPWGEPLPRSFPDRERDEALRQGRTFVSNVVTTDSAGRPFVYVVVPVVSQGTGYRLAYAFLPSAFASALNPQRFSPGTVTSIVDREGTIVSRHPNGERFAGGKATPDIVRSVLAHEEARAQSVTLEGVPVLAAHSRAPFSGWSVAMGVPLSGLYASAQRMLWLGLATSAVLMAIAISMAVWIGRALVRSIDALVADTRKIAGGEVPAARPEGLVETEIIADAVRSSARQLQQRNDENTLLARALKEELEQRRRSEESVRRLAAIVESSDDAIISKTLDGTITSWNTGAERLFGYTSPEVLGRSISLLIPPDREHEARQIVARIREGRRIEHFESVRLRKDGTRVPISLTISPLYDHDGRVVGASKISRDISHRLRSEAEQHALYELVARVNRAEALPEIYDAALDALGRCSDAHRAAILLNDARGVMRFVASRRLSEEYRQAVEGHSPWQPDDPNPQPQWIDDIAAARIDPALKAAIEREGIRGLAFVPLRYERRLLGKFMIYFDAPHGFSRAELRPAETIASQVAFAIERQRDAEELEALVEERTSSLRQLIAQMEEFSYSVSHDLRAPVRAMRGFADMILQDHGSRLDSDARDLLSRIVRNGARMDRLIQDLLTYSRISRREVQLEPVSLDKLVRDVVQQYPDMRPERADIQVESPLPEVLAHEPSLTQVVSNLLSNAVKFVPPEGRARVRISADRSAARARLRVQDNGIGIKPEHQSRLFGMFERVHPERNYEGTGIGLAIVRKAVERMNGTVGVESDGVSGSCFWFELPLAERPDVNGHL